MLPRSAISTTDPASSATMDEASFTPWCHSLLEFFLAVPDGRSHQGRDHPVAVVLALVAMATVAGLKGYNAMSGWVADVPPTSSMAYTRGSMPVRSDGRPARRCGGSAPIPTPTSWTR